MSSRPAGWDAPEAHFGRSSHPEIMLGAPSQRAEPAQAEHSRLLEKLRKEPFDLADLRRFFEQAQLLAAIPEALVAGQILSLFEPTIEVPQSRFRAELMLGEEAWHFVHDELDHELLQLTRILWTSLRAIPQLRRTPESSGLEERQRAAPGDKAGLMPAYARITKLLGRTEVALYQKPRSDPELYALPCFPPCIVARAKLVPDSTVVFRLAQLLVYCEPEHAVTCLLPETEGRDLLGALLGAFGPPGTAGNLSRAGKDYAAQLWHAVPVRVQSQLRELVRSRLPVLDYDRLQGRAALCAARAGLLVSLDVRSAIEGLTGVEPTLHDFDVHTQLGFEACYANSRTLRELIRCAFSESYLALTGLRANA